jgi:hypothetical protein
MELYIIETSNTVSVTAAISAAVAVVSTVYAKAAVV